MKKMRVSDGKVCSKAHCCLQSSVHMDKRELHSCGTQSSLNVVGCSLGSPTTVKHGENCNFDEVADVFNWTCFSTAELLPLCHRAAWSLA